MFGIIIIPHFIPVCASVCGEREATQYSATVLIENNIRNFCRPSLVIHETCIDMIYDQSVKVYPEFEYNMRTFGEKDEKVTTVLT